MLGWAALSMVGYLGKDTIYKNYSINLQTTPYFVLVLEGLRDGIYPWSNEPGDFWEQWEIGGDHFFDPEQGWMTQETSGVAEGTELEEISDTETAGPREFVQVDESYFDDAVFIGDSRTVGLHDYGGLDKATFYATVGLNVYDMWTDKFCEVDGEKMTLEEALKTKQYKKIYFQIGINEMGRGTLDSFMEAYMLSIQKFRELQPDAIIYVQGIMRVTKEKSDEDAIFNNKGINERNDRIADLADGQTIFYIDVNDVVCDEDGNLRDDLTFDNLHLYGSKYGIWVDFLLTKGIEPLAST